MNNTINLEKVMEQTNDFFGKLNPNDENNLHYSVNSPGVLEVKNNRFGIPEKYGTGLYLTIFGTIFRKHFFDKKTDQEYLEDIKISPICLFPYELIEYTESDQEGNLPDRYTQELRAYATVHTTRSLYHVRDIIINDTHMSNGSNFKTFLKQISATSGWVDLSIHNILNKIEKRNQYVFESIGKRIEGVTCLGFHRNTNPTSHDDWFYVGYQESINKADRQKDVRPLSTRVSLSDAELTKAKLIKPDEVPGVITEHLFDFNHLGLTSQILGLTASYFVKERLYREHTIKFPNIVVIGLPGTGKNGTFEEIVMPMLGMDNTYMTIGSAIREFPLQKLLTNSNTLPIIVSEYKPHEMTKRSMDIINSAFNNCYDRSTMQRGRSNLSMVEYPLNSSLIILGEAIDLDNSRKDRTVYMQFDKKNMNPEFFVELKKHKKMLTRIGKTLLCKALGYKAEQLKEMFDKNRDLLKEYILPQRPGDNLLLILLGLDMLGEVLGIDVKKNKMASIKKFMADTMEDSESAVNAIEQLLEDISMNVGDWVDSNNIMTDEENVYIRINKVFPELEREYLSRGQKVPITKASFKKQALGLGWVEPARKRFDGERNTTACLAFSKTELIIVAESKELDYSGLKIEALNYDENEREGIENDKSE